MSWSLPPSRNRHRQLPSPMEQLSWQHHLLCLSQEQLKKKLTFHWEALVVGKDKISCLYSLSYLFHLYYFWDRLYSKSIISVCMCLHFSIHPNLCTTQWTRCHDNHRSYSNSIQIIWNSICVVYIFKEQHWGTDKIFWGKWNVYLSLRTPLLWQWVVYSKKGVWKSALKVLVWSWW